MSLIPFAPFSELGKSGLDVFPLLSDLSLLTSVLWFRGLEFFDRWLLISDF